MDEQRYWRSLIGREIKAEHDRVKKYYSQRSMNSGGISSEEQTRLNIFLLCQSLAEKYNEDIVPVNQVEEKPRVKKEVPLAEPIIEKSEDINDFIEEEIARVDTNFVNTHSSDPKIQNEFGEMI